MQRLPSESEVGRIVARLPVLLARLLGAPPANEPASYVEREGRCIVEGESCAS
jgi:hypothetical protein